MNIRNLIRQTVYQAEKASQQAKFSGLAAPAQGWPILLGISFPKSGTHLLDQILLGFSQVAPFSRRLHSFYAQYEGESGRKRTPQETAAWLRSLKPLDIASAHLFSTPETLEQVLTPAFVPYFIYRDPRDVAVSHVFYVTEMAKNHVHHTYYQNLINFDERLTTSILGIPNSTVEFPNIAARFEPYLGWVEQPLVLNIHFEDLILQRTETLTRIAAHLLKRVPLQFNQEQVVNVLEQAINPAKSPTFRSGKTGEWKKYFKEEHKQVFKQVAGKLLIKLGYEKDLNW